MSHADNAGSNSVQALDNINLANVDRKNCYRGVNLVGDLELFAGVQHNGCDGWVVRVADAREQVVHHL